MPFEAVDDQGVAGVITRTGSASFDGTTLDVVVPTLAKTGTLRVLGAADTQELQIVPVIRSIGGTIAEGETLLIDGSGFVEGEIIVTIDGQTATTFNTISVVDSIGSNRLAQQLLEVTLPAGVADASNVALTTNGGTFTLSKSSLTILADLTPANDPADTIATANAVNLPVENRMMLLERIGAVGSTSSTRDVDLYEFTLNTDEQFTADISSGFTLRLFDNTGLLQTATVTGVNQQTWSIATDGTYYLGVNRGFGNYDPNTAGSMNRSETPADYLLSVERATDLAESGVHRLDAITTTAASGTPRLTGIASANTGQTITLAGTGFLPGDQVVFLVDDTNGSIFEQIITPASVSGDGTTIEVAIPTNAVTGTVRLRREDTGLLLQVVPVLTEISSNGAQLTGTGFVEGATTIDFGGAILVDPSTSSSVIDVSRFGFGSLNLSLPNSVVLDSITVSTYGGTSETIAIETTSAAITSAASSTSDSVAGLNRIDLAFAELEDELSLKNDSLEGGEFAASDIDAFFASI